MFGNKLGDFIRKQRGAVSLRDFAKQCNISHTHLDSIEKGFDPRTGKPVRVTTETLKNLADGMGREFLELAALAENMDFEKIKEKISSDRKFRMELIKGSGNCTTASDGLVQISKEAKPENYLFSDERVLIDYYRELSEKGKNELCEYAAYCKSRYPKEVSGSNSMEKDCYDNPHLIPNAAHDRTDIQVTDEMKEHDNAFFDED